MTENIHLISNIIYDIKEKITDEQYKLIMDNLYKLHKNEDIDMQIVNQYYKNFFFHSHQNNYCFHYIYNQQRQTLTTIYENEIQTFKVGDEFVYEKDYVPERNQVIEIKAKIIKITPKYVIIDLHGWKKKHTNITFCKCVNFPNINLY